jgi:hypothetical protein
MTCQLVITSVSIPYHMIKYLLKYPFELSISLAENSRIQSPVCFFLLLWGLLKTYLINYLFTYSLTHLLTYWFTHLLTHSLAHSLTHSLTPWSIVLEKLTGFQLVKKFLVFCGNRRFITTVTSVCHLSSSWASFIQSIPPHTTSWWSILILSSYLHLTSLED